MLSKTATFITTKAMLLKCFTLLLVLLPIVTLPACSSVPIFTPDMAMQAPKPISLANANGPISHQKAKKIIANMQKNSVETSIFDKHLALIASIIGSPLIIGNKVDILLDGPSTYAAMLSAIASAKDHINMETYIIEDDEIGQQFATVLIAKQQSGVQVNLIYDSAGSHNTPTAFFETLIQAGINVLEFNPINPLDKRKDWQWNQRDHRKLLIVDGKIAFLGGINISSVYSSGSSGGSSSGASKKPSQKKSIKISLDDENKIPWRDTHLQVAGPVVAEFQKMFTETWQQQKGRPLAAKDYFPILTAQGNAIVRAIGSNPEEPFSQIYATLLSAINSAETQVFLTNAYFVPDPQLLTALKDAAKRGADVRLLLPERTDSSLVFYASRSYYDELLSANIKIYEHQVALLHAKTALIDGVWSTVGSTNLDWRSFVNNQEINAVMLGQDFGMQMQQLFDADLASSKQITLQQWRQRSLGARIKEQSARLWARFL